MTIKQSSITAAPETVWRHRNKRRLLVQMALGVGLVVAWKCGFADAPTIGGETGAFPAFRILWVDQNDPHAADNADGSETTPFKTISQAAQAVRPGDLVKIRTGTYRETVKIKISGEASKPIRFEAAPGAYVVVTGADQIDRKTLTREPGPDNIFSLAWPHKFLLYAKKDGSGTHPDNDYHKVIGRCEQVVVDGYLLHQVLDRSQLSRGSFYVDLTNQRLYVWDSSNIDLKGFYATAEASIRPEVWLMSGDDVQVSGIRFRYASNRAQEGAVQIMGKNDLMEDCVIERTNGVGLVINGEDAIVRRCLIRDNGELGFGGARCHRLLITECTIRNNNTKNFDRSWECGNCKIVLTRDAVFEKSIFADSRGVGMWFDIGDENCTVRNCLITDNENAGIFYEICYGLHAHDNVIVGNGFDSGGGAWGGDGAISLSNSPGCVIERNLMVGNYDGFQLKEKIRTTPRIDQPKGGPEEPIWNHDEVLKNNVIAYNLKWQIGFWPDIKDDYRQWPLLMRDQFPGQAKSAEAVADITKDYVAKSNQGQPADLSLEKLNLQFQDNIYSQDPAEKFCIWGVPWRSHKEYADLNAMRTDLKLENGSVEIPLIFGDTAMLDFRVPADSPIIKMNCYPQGAVPGVKLGTLP